MKKTKKTFRKPRVHESVRQAQSDLDHAVVRGEPPERLEQLRQLLHQAEQLTGTRI